MNALALEPQTGSWRINRLSNSLGNGRWKCEIEDDVSESPSKQSDEGSLSPELIRYLFEKGQMACNVERLWRDLTQKWRTHGGHVQSPERAHCVYLPALGIVEQAADTDAELQVIFRGLVDNWKSATGGYSLTYRRYAHPSYQAILTLGKREVVPMILRELQQHPDLWFEALKVLTNKNPAANAKTFDEAVQCWVEWGKKENLIP